MFKTRGNPICKGRGCSLSQVQIKDSGLTQGVDDEASPFLAVKLSLLCGLIFISKKRPLACEQAHVGAQATCHVLCRAEKGPYV